MAPHCVAGRLQRQRRAPAARRAGRQADRQAPEAVAVARVAAPPRRQPPPDELPVARVAGAPLAQPRQPPRRRGHRPPMAAAGAPAEDAVGHAHWPPVRLPRPTALADAGPDEVEGRVPRLEQHGPQSLRVRSE